MFGLLLYKALSEGETAVEECLHHAVAYDGRIYDPNEVHDLLVLSKEAKYSYMLHSSSVGI
jgi:hypothetical protein